ncbi:MAG: hypothetical protein MI976_08195 [Pseudomonadales bacterium]|nr:hypothetical protein [Pseudomonadales bacterium]
MDATQIHENLNQMLETSLETTLRESANDKSWEIKRVNGIDQFAMSHCIVLTISSFRFRVMVILHMNFDDRVRHFLADLLGIKLQEADSESLMDRLMELCNSFCGHVKRHLQDTCPPLGMSTPNLLDSSCLVLDGVVDVAHEAHVMASDMPGAEPLFGATTLVSLLSESDFEVSQPQKLDGGGELESFGELELF